MPLYRLIGTQPLELEGGTLLLPVPGRDYGVANATPYVLSLVADGILELIDPDVPGPTPQPLYDPVYLVRGSDRLVYVRIGSSLVQVDLAGTPGPAGPGGPAGAKGDPGDRGPAGESFTFRNVWDAAVADYQPPDVVLGSDGKAYIAENAVPAGVNPTVDVTSYQPPVAGAHWSPFPIIGGEGPPGPAGAPGAPGAPGAQGPPGSSTPLLFKLAGVWQTRPDPATAPRVVFVGASGFPGGDPMPFVVGDEWHLPDGRTMYADGARWTREPQSTSSAARVPGVTPGTVLIRHPLLWPFAKSSPWNLPLALAAIAEAVTGPATKTLRGFAAVPGGGGATTLFVNSGANGWGHDRAWASIDSPVADVYDANATLQAQLAIGGHLAVQVPPDYFGAAEGDGYSAVLSPDARRVTEWEQIRRLSGGPSEPNVVPTFRADRRPDKTATITSGSATIARTSAAKVITAADATADTVTVPAHELKTGSAVLFYDPSGTGAAPPPAGIAAGTTLFAIVVSVDVLKLATSKANALAGTAIDLTSAATGAGMRFGDGAPLVFQYFRNSAGVASQANPDQDTLGGLARDGSTVLERGRTYYAVNSTGVDYGVALTPGGTAIVPAAAGFTVAIPFDQAPYPNSFLGYTDPYGSGWGVMGPRSAKGSGAGGQVTPDEIAAGVIPHLVCGGAATKLLLPARGGVLAGYVWPATGQDSFAITGFGFTKAGTLDQTNNRIALTAHARQVGDPVRVESGGGGATGLVNATVYWVVAVPTPDTLQLSATFGGAPVTIGANTAVTLRLYGGIGLGQLFRLPPSFSVATVMQTPSGRMLAQAWKDYGWRPVDASGSATEFCEVLRGRTPAEQAASANFVAELLANNAAELKLIAANAEAVANDAQATPGGDVYVDPAPTSGAGARRVALAPDLVAA